MPIRAVMCDFGGVLMRTHDYSGRHRWAACLGLSEPELERVVFESEPALRGLRGELPAHAMWQHVASTFHLDEAELGALRRDFWAGDRLDDELVGFLKSLRPRYRTALLSNAWDDARDLFTRRFHLDGAFDLMVISAEEGVIKPDPRIYGIALERLGVRPAGAVFVDDMPANVEAARALGIHGIRFLNTAQVIADVRALLDGETSSVGRSRSAG